jgi:hypothetical protein
VSSIIGTDEFTGDATAAALTPEGAEEENIVFILGLSLSQTGYRAQLCDGMKGMLTDSSPIAQLFWAMT